MGNLFNEDFRDFITALEHADVRYLLVGGYAVIIHGYNRTTGDMDIWVDQTPKNYAKIGIAFREFGMPVFDMTIDKFMDTANYDVFTFGVSPTQIDLLTNINPDHAIGSVDLCQKTLIC